jgi:hypothetical protein
MGAVTPGVAGTSGQPNAAIPDGTNPVTVTPKPGVAGAAAASTKTPSGKYWVTWADTNAKGSQDADDLEDSFKENAKTFIKALEDGKATVSVGETKRDEKRAYLYHWSWLIALDKAKPSAATAKTGVDIEWDHGDAAKSKAGAQEIVDGFGLAVPPKSTNAPALDSNHIRGKAIDITIKWTGKATFKKKDAKKDDPGVEIDYKEDVNSNTQLIDLGKTYGLIKLTTDAPHWSVDGR